MSVYAVFDCENVDTVLGREILNRKPLPWDRLEYRRVIEWLEKYFQNAARVVAVVREGDGPARSKRMKFANALHCLGIKVVFAENYASLNSLCAPTAPELVDTVVADLISKSGASVICYGGHDFYASFPLRQKREAGARVFGLGFPEFVSAEVIATVEQVFDLESDIGGFAHPLPRLRLF
jgi:ABC-type branched-subunit amino acid transport system substrate-binding protein